MPGETNQESGLAGPIDSPDFNIDNAIDAIAEGQGLDIQTEEGVQRPQKAPGEGDDKAAAAPAKPAEGEAKPAEPKGAEAPPVTDKAAVAAPAAAPVATPPPETWTAGAKAQWAALPADIQAEVLKREGDFQKGINQYAQGAKIGDKFVEILKPYLPIYQQAGVQAGTLVPQVLQAHAVMAWGTPQQKVEMFRALAQDAGIDPTKLTVGDGTSAFDPKILRMERELAELRQGQQKVFSAAHESRVAAYEKDVIAFANDPKNVHFEAVAEGMRDLLERGVAKTIPDAYDKAVHLNPITRAKEFDRLATERSAQLAKDAADRVTKARKATGASVKSSEQSGTAQKPLGSIDDTLNETLAEIRSRE